MATVTEDGFPRVPEARRKNLGATQPRIDRATVIGNRFHELVIVHHETEAHGVQDFEKLGAFYLGKTYDLEHRAVNDELVLYDSKDLCTHAVCVGMTGSGKTGLCLSLLEEAAIDGVPAIAIDPKGDLANLLLTFPDLAPDDFLPWIDSGDATRAGMTDQQFASETARRWKAGLAEWGQTPDRISRFRDAVDIAVYTPGNNSGLPLTVLRSFDVPPRAVLEDADAYRQHLGATSSGLLALMGIEADSLQSREHILVCSLLDRAWREGRQMDLGSLIHEIRRPPIERVGVVDLETFFPEKDRVQLAMRLNNLLASPTFAGWMEGEPLNVNRLLHTAEGKPRISILSIAHLSEAERLFFVTILLNEVVAWTRSQPGTSSLRALLYMDEVFGYFPPTANPPTKQPMLTLLKQARAYGLGVVLATQNPVDLDYRGLSNIGTWFLGRLQTERDKSRLIEGLEGAAVQSGGGFDRAAMEATLAALGSRVFLMNNVHDDEPLIFHTRWALSYLRGPMTRGQIKTLTDPGRAAAVETPAAPTAVSPKQEKVAKKSISGSSRPTLPSDIQEGFLPATKPRPDGTRLVYRPALLGRVKLHFSRSTYKVDTWQAHSFLAPLSDSPPASFWDDALSLAEGSGGLHTSPDPDGRFADAPAELGRARSYTTWAKQLKTYCYRDQAVTVWKCAALKAYSEPGEPEGDFRVRLAQQARQKRDLAVEKLRKRYGSKLATMKERIRSAEDRLRREKSEYRTATLDSALSMGSSLLQAFFGRKLASVTNVGRASSSMRKVTGAAKQRGDIGSAEEKLQAYLGQLKELEQQFEEDVRKTEQSLQTDALELESLSLKPLKTDIQVDSLSVAWTPWHVDSSGIADPAFESA